MVETTTVAAMSITDSLLVLTPMLGSTLLAYGVIQVILDLRGNRKQKVLDRLRDRSGRTDAKQREAKEKLILKRTAEIADGSLAWWVSKLSFVPKFQEILYQANVDWAASRTLLNLFATFVLVTSGLLMAQCSVLTALVAGLGVFVLPIFVLLRKRKKRMKKLVEQLPDCFELMSQALRAGHSLASGIQLVSEQMPDPIGTEMGRVFHEQNLGIKMEDALTAMADRVNQLDVRFFVTSILIQRQTGGDLAEVLDKMGSVVRDRIALLGMVQALTAEGRLSGWVLLALPVLVFFVVMGLNPDYAGTLIHDSTGRMLLIAAVAMMLMGMAMIKKIVNIKV